MCKLKTSSAACRQTGRACHLQGALDVDLVASIAADQPHLVRILGQVQRQHLAQGEASLWQPHRLCVNPLPSASCLSGIGYLPVTASRIATQAHLSNAASRRCSNICIWTWAPHLADNGCQGLKVARPDARRLQDGDQRQRRLELLEGSLAYTPTLFLVRQASCVSQA